MVRSQMPSPLGHGTALMMTLSRFINITFKLLFIIFRKTEENSGNQENFFLMNSHNVVLASSYAPDTLIWDDEDIDKFNFTEKEHVVLSKKSNQQHELLFKVHQHITEHYDYVWGAKNEGEFTASQYFPNHVVDVARLNKNVLLGNFFFPNVDFVNNRAKASKKESTFLMIEHHPIKKI